MTVDRGRAPSWLVAAATAALVLLAIAGAGNHDLWAYDEPREAEIARAAWRSGNHVVLELGQQPFLDKPPLFHATVAAGYAVVGAPSIVAARVVTALWALAALAGTAWLARRTLGPGTGILAALVLATSYRFHAVSHEILLDNALVAFTTWAIALGHVAGRERRRGLATLAGLALAGAFLTKGVVGVGIAGLVLGLDLVGRRDRAGARTLLHPGAVLAFALPVALYVGALLHVAGPRGPDFLRQLFWANQFGRFVGSHLQKSSHWYLYAVTWPEMLGAWAPLAGVALLSGLRRVKRDPSPEARDTLRFLAVWAVVPLVVLSLARGRARPYSVPMIPAYACLVAAWWRAVVEPGHLPAWARRLLGGATLAGALLVAATVVAIAVLVPRGVGRYDVAGAALALLAGGGLVAGRVRRSDFASSGGAAVLVGLVPLAGLLVFSGELMAKRRDRERSYRPLAEEVFAVAGPRRICLYHVSNSYSGTFAFYRDRSALELDDVLDPDGAKLMTELGPAALDVVVAPRRAFDELAPERRADLAVVWSGIREDDRSNPDKAWVLCERRPPPPPEVTSATH